MAATIATAVGHDANRDKRATRLGGRSATGHADTYRTFATCHVNADGSGCIEVRRGERGLGGRVNTTEVLHRFDFGPEDGS